MITHSQLPVSFTAAAQLLAEAPLAKLLLTCFKPHSRFQLLCNLHGLQDHLGALVKAKIARARLSEF